MSPRIVRNLAGAVALTGLALALACGGNDPSDPIVTQPQRPTTPLVTSSTLLGGNTAITRHTYRITVSATDPQGESLTYSIEHGEETSLITNDGGGVFTYVPGSSAIGSDTLVLRVENESGLSTSRPWIVSVRENANPQLPGTARDIAIQSGAQFMATDLPTVDTDGDTVNWTHIATAANSSFIANRGTVTMNPSSTGFTVNATGVAPGVYSFPIRSLEVGGQNALRADIETIHTVNITVFPEDVIPVVPTITELPGEPNLRLSHHNINLRVSSTDKLTPISYTAAVTHAGAAVGTVTTPDATTGLFTYKASTSVTPADYPTTATIRVTAVNAAGTSTSADYIISNIQPNQVTVPYAPAQPIVIAHDGSTTIYLPRTDLNGDEVGYNIGTLTGLVAADITGTDENRTIVIRAGNMTPGAKTIALTPREIGTSNGLHTPLTGVTNSVVIPFTVQEAPPAETTTAIFTSPNPSGQIALIGLEKEMNFSAMDQAHRTDEVITWTLTGIGGIEGGNPAPLGLAFVNNNGIITAPDGKTPLKSVSGKEGRTGQSIDVLFSPQAADNYTAGQRVTFGLRADFNSSYAYEEFYLDTRNSSGARAYLPTASGATEHYADTTGLSIITVAPQTPSGSLQQIAPVTAQAEIPIKGFTDGSLEIVSTIDTTQAPLNLLKFYSPDIEYRLTGVNIKATTVTAFGDTLVLDTSSGSSNNEAAFAALLDRLGVPGKLEVAPTTGFNAALRPILIESRDDSDLVGETAVVTYTIYGSDGNTLDTTIGAGELGNAQFLGTEVGVNTVQFTVKYADNHPPIIDGADLHDLASHVATKGNDEDVWKWETGIPAEGQETIFKIPVHKTQSAPGYIYSKGDGQAYLWYTVNNMTAAKDKALKIAPNGIASEFTLTWTPAPGTKSSSYSYDLQAFNKFGAASNKITVTDNILGIIEGAPVSTLYYGKFDDTAVFPTSNPIFAESLADNEGIGSAEVDFSDAHVRLVYRPFNAGTNKYSKESVAFSPDEDETSIWAAGPYEAGSYLVAGQQSNGKAVPGIGSTVTSQNFIKTNNAPTFAYINSTAPDLTTYTSLGVLGASSIEKLTGTTPPTLVNAGNPDLSKYYGNLYMIFANGTTPEAEDNIIQMVFPTIGQKTLVYGWKDVTSATSGFVDADYNPTLAWNASVATHASETQTSPISGISYNPIAVDLNKVSDAAGQGHLVYKTTKDDPNMLSVLQNVKANATVNGTAAGDLPYWVMTRTGRSITDITTDEETPLPNTLITPQTSYLTPTVGSTVNFNGTISRDKFATMLPWVVTDNEGLVPADDIVDSETLQVLAYVSGTDLGATENPAGVPVYLEFGDLNAVVPFDKHVLNIGTIPVPNPDDQVKFWDPDMNNFQYAKAWLGQETPVTHYTVNYASPITGLPASAGLITPTVAAGVTTDLQPVTGVKITVKDGETFTTAPLTPTGTFSTTATPVAIDKVGISVGTAEKGDLAHLSWVNPPVNTYSGNIIEFYPGNTGHSLDSVPLYRVVVGPGTSSFPIPEEWSTAISKAKYPNDTATNGLAIIKIRTVAYGTPGTANFVDLNKTPFISALPAAWVDTLTTTVNFKGLEKASWAANTPVTFDPTEIKLTPGAGTSVHIPSDVIITWTTDIPNVTSLDLEAGTDYNIDWTSTKLTSTANTLDPVLTLTDPAANWGKDKYYDLEGKITYNTVTNATGKIKLTSDGWRTGVNLNEAISPSILNGSTAKDNDVINYTLSFGPAADTSVLISQPTFTWSVGDYGASTGLVKGTHYDYTFDKNVVSFKILDGEKFKDVAKASNDGLKFHAKMLYHGFEVTRDIKMAVIDDQNWNASYEIKTVSPADKIAFTPSKADNTINLGTPVAWEVNLTGTGQAEFKDSSASPSTSPTYEYSWTGIRPVAGSVIVGAAEFTNATSLNPGVIKIASAKAGDFAKGDYELTYSVKSGNVTNTNGKVVVTSDGWRTGANLAPTFTSTGTNWTGITTTPTKATGANFEVDMWNWKAGTSDTVSVTTNFGTAADTSRTATEPTWVWTVKAQTGMNNNLDAGTDYTITVNQNKVDFKILNETAVAKLKEAGIIEFEGVPTITGATTNLTVPLKIGFADSSFHAGTPIVFRTGTGTTAVAQPVVYSPAKYASETTPFSQLYNWVSTGSTVTSGNIQTNFGGNAPEYTWSVKNETNTTPLTANVTMVNSSTLTPSFYITTPNNNTYFAKDKIISLGLTIKADKDGDGLWDVTNNNGVIQFKSNGWRTGAVDNSHISVEPGIKIAAEGTGELKTTIELKSFESANTDIKWGVGAGSSTVTHKWVKSSENSALGTLDDWTLTNVGNVWTAELKDSAKANWKANEILKLDLELTYDGATIIVDEPDQGNIKIGAANVAFTKDTLITFGGDYSDTTGANKIVYTPGRYTTYGNKYETDPVILTWSGDGTKITSQNATKELAVAPRTSADLYYVWTSDSDAVTVGGTAAGNPAGTTGLSPTFFIANPADLMNASKFGANVDMKLTMEINVDTDPDTPNYEITNSKGAINFISNGWRPFSGSATNNLLTGGTLTPGAQTGTLFEGSTAKTVSGKVGVWEHTTTTVKSSTVGTDTKFNGYTWTIGEITKAGGGTAELGDAEITAQDPTEGTYTVAFKDAAAAAKFKQNDTIKMDLAITYDGVTVNVPAYDTITIAKDAAFTDTTDITIGGMPAGPIYVTPATGYTVPAGTTLSWSGDNTLTSNTNIVGSTYATTATHQWVAGTGMTGTDLDISPTATTAAPTVPLFTVKAASGKIDESTWDAEGEIKLKLNIVFTGGTLTGTTNSKGEVTLKSNGWRAGNTDLEDDFTVVVTDTGSLRAGYNADAGIKAAQSKLAAADTYKITGLTSWSTDTPETTVSSTTTDKPFTYLWELGDFTGAQGAAKTDLVFDSTALTLGYAGATTADKIVSAGKFALADEIPLHLNITYDGVTVKAKDAVKVAIAAAPTPFASNSAVTFGEDASSLWGKAQGNASKGADNIPFTPGKYGTMGSLWQQSHFSPEPISWKHTASGINSDTVTSLGKVAYEWKGSTANTNLYVTTNDTGFSMAPQGLAPSFFTLNPNDDAFAKDATFRLDMVIKIDTDDDGVADITNTENTHSLWFTSNGWRNAEAVRKGFALKIGAGTETSQTGWLGEANKDATANVQIIEWANDATSISSATEDANGDPYKFGYKWQLGSLGTTTGSGILADLNLVDNADGSCVVSFKNQDAADKFKEDDEIYLDCAITYDGVTVVAEKLHKITVAEANGVFGDGTAIEFDVPYNTEIVITPGKYEAASKVWTVAELENKNVSWSGLLTDTNSKNVDNLGNVTYIWTPPAGVTVTSLPGKDQNALNPSFWIGPGAAGSTKAGDGLDLTLNILIDTPTGTPNINNNTGTITFKSNGWGQTNATAIAATVTPVTTNLTDGIEVSNSPTPPTVKYTPGDADGVLSSAIDAATEITFKSWTVGTVTRSTGTDLTTKAVTLSPGADATTVIVDITRGGTGILWAGGNTIKLNLTLTYDGVDVVLEDIVTITVKAD